jgi:hypothetical protein
LIAGSNDMRCYRRTAPAILLLSAALLTLALVGCSRGPVIGQVSGKVTFHKKPVTEGTVTFINPTSGFVAEAKLDKDGSYVIQNPEGGLAVGDYLVMVTPPIYIDSSDPKEPPSPTEKPAPNIPDQYRNQGRTPLKAKVVYGPNTFDFDMTK